MPSLGAARRSSGSPPTKSRLPWSSVAGGRVALFLFELLERVIGVTSNMVRRHRRRRLRGITRTAAQAQHHQHHHAQSQSPVSYSLSLHRLPLAHRFQLTGAVADSSAIHIGRLLGADSVLIYRIDGPSWRDRMWARQASDLPPILVTSKLIRVESAEVLYHRVIVAQLEESAVSGWWDGQDAQRLSRAALERGIRETVVELGRAFD